MQEIVPGIFVETIYPPYNLGLIPLDEGALVIDAPPRPSHAQAWLHQAREHIPDLRYLVLTDATPERLIGAAACNLPIIGTEAALRSLSGKLDREWHDLVQKMAERYPEESAAIHALALPRITLACDDAFTFYQRTPPVQFKAVAGTTPGALFITLPEHNLLFAGDAVTIDAPLPLEYAEDSKAWLNLLGDLAYDPHIQQIVPGRGRAVILRGEIEQVREFLRVIRRTSRGLAHAGREASYKQPAQDLGQTFYNQGGQNAVKWITRGLKHLVAEIERKQAAAVASAAVADAEV